MMNPLKRLLNIGLMTLSLAGTPSLEQIVSASTAEAATHHKTSAEQVAYNNSSRRGTKTRSHQTPAVKSRRKHAPYTIDGITYRDYYYTGKQQKGVRDKTYGAIVHCTEGNLESAIHTLQPPGKVHYIIAEDGTVFNILPDNLVTYHAGNSMWNGIRNLDKYYIGIEMVGTYKKDFTAKQYTALRLLLKKLIREYRFNSDHVFPHAAVACNYPNRHNDHYVRGRRLDGRLIAMPLNRDRLDLGPMSRVDPDQVRGIMDGNINNNRIMYGRNNFGNLAYQNNRLDNERLARLTRFDGSKIERILIDSTFADLTQIDSTRVDKAAIDVEEYPNGFLEINYTQKRTAWSLVGNQYKKNTTIYFLPDGMIRTGQELTRETLDHLPNHTRILQGYVYGGKVTKERSLMSIAGKEWNYPTTKYRFPNKKDVNGQDVNPKYVPIGTLVLFRD